MYGEATLRSFVAKQYNDFLKRRIDANPAQTTRFISF